MTDYLAGLAEVVADMVDDEAVVDLVRAAVGIPSITPNERNFAQWVHQELSDGSWDVKLVDCEPGRPNVYATVGNGNGKSLLLAGHTDTVAVDDWVEYWQGDEREDPFGAQIIDGDIWGRGVTDQKAGICVVIEAMRTIRRAGYQPNGRVMVLFVCDEESGQPGSGISAGMRSAVTDVLSDAQSQPDFAIYTEPTTSAIYTAQMGFLIADITLLGKSAYFGRPELGIDALIAGHRLLSQLWEYSDKLRARPIHPLLGEAFLLVTSVRSGGNIAVPGRFELSLIRKVLPGEDLDEAAKDLQILTKQIASETDTEANIVFTAPRDHPVGGTPDELDHQHPGVINFAESITAVTGDEARLEGAPYWSEKPFFTALGIPSVYFAPGDISECHTPFERLSVDELITATRILTHFIARWCGLVDIQQGSRKEDR